MEVWPSRVTRHSCRIKKGSHHKSTQGRADDTQHTRDGISAVLLSHLDLLSWLLLGCLRPGACGQGGPESRAGWRRCCRIRRPACGGHSRGGARVQHETSSKPAWMAFSVWSRPVNQDLLTMASALRVVTGRSSTPFEWACAHRSRIEMGVRPVPGTARRSRSIDAGLVPRHARLTSLAGVDRRRPHERRCCRG